VFHDVHVACDGERGQVAQVVERSPEKAGVGGSTPSLATIKSIGPARGHGFTYVSGRSNHFRTPQNTILSQSVPKTLLAGEFASTRNSAPAKQWQK
jgi:hypothetical protein